MNVGFQAPNAFPWMSRPAMLARFGLAAQAALTNAYGEPVVIEAFELGNVRPKNRALKLALLLLLSPIWVLLFAFAAVILAIPSMIYIPYRTWREWDEARSLGVSSGLMIFNIVIVIGFGFAGGIILTMVLLDKIFPVGNQVVVAKAWDRIFVLYQQLPLINFPQFRAIEFCPAGSVSLQAPATSKRVVLVLQGGDTPTEIVVRRGLQSFSGSPEVNEANLRLLLGASVGQLYG